jgi:1,2-diacylglycerol 3-beta-glucosyltransferase
VTVRTPAPTRTTHRALAEPNALPPRLGSPWMFPLVIGMVLVIGTFVGYARLGDVLIVALELVYLIFFLRHVGFALAALDTASTDIARHDDARPAVPTTSVTVFVPCKNEAAVVERLVTSLLALDYPTHLLDLVIVNDGSSDDTGTILDRLTAKNRRLRVIHRPPNAGGGKSAALNAALEITSADVIVVFDADHQPHKDVIWRLARHFNDPSVGAVQGRCRISNGDDSPLAGLISIDYLAGYLVNEYGRQALFELPAYGGANCAVRASSLRAVGGWNENSVTEDTDLTIRLMLGGERVRYDVTAVDEEEAVVTLGRYWRQRYRWARGHQQIARDYWRSVRYCRFIGRLEKIETAMYLLIFHVPVLSAAGLVLLGAWLAGIYQIHAPSQAFFLWTLMLLGPLLELGAGMIIAKTSRRTAMYLLLFPPVYFVSIALCTKAWIDGTLGRPYSWAKTPRAQDPDPSGPPVIEAAPAPAGAR